MMSVAAIEEHDGEPVHGLPEALPDGERLLWQGRPNWRSVARHALHARKLAAYFGALLAWYVLAKLSAGLDPAQVALTVAQLAGAAALMMGMLAFYAWGTSRATVYTITDRRLVMRFGLVVPVSFNLPFRKIASASLKAFADGTGDVAVQLERSEHIGWFILWPHARPWRMKHAQPALRGVDDAERVARTLARALAGSASMPVPAVVGSASAAARPEAALA